MTTIDATPLALIPVDENSNLHHWQRCMEDFLQMERDRTGSEATYYNYSMHLRHFFQQDYPDKHPADICKQDVIKFIHHPSRGRHNHGQPASVHAINQRLTVIRSFYTFALDYDVPGPDGRPQRLFQVSNPARGIPYGQTPRKINYLTEDEIKRFFAAIPDTEVGKRNRAIFITFFYTARRRQEILRLSFGDLEQATLSEKDGSTRQSWIYKFRGKGRSRIEDSAELPEPAQTAIWEYLEASGRLAHMHPDSPLFVSVYKGARQENGINARGITQQMKEYARAAGITKTVSLHIWRHSAARMRKELGADLMDIRKLLRHQRVDTTMKYLELLSTPNDADAAKLAERFADL